jgi:hypothetical protein
MGIGESARPAANTVAIDKGHRVTSQWPSPSPLPQRQRTASGAMAIDAALHDAIVKHAAPDTAQPAR